VATPITTRHYCHPMLNRGLSSPTREAETQLYGLEKDGLVKRTPYATTPPRVDYELTELGESLIKPLATLASWAQANRAKIDSARLRQQRRRKVN
jgi:DNA-binding HxlR family transcriptional regulator